MQQRQPRLGDILDDYCPRERRLTNHVVVAMIGDAIKQTRCTTCDADHEYKHAAIPRQRKKAEESTLYSQVLAGVAPKKVVSTQISTDDAQAEPEPQVSVPVPESRPHEAAGVADFDALVQASDAEPPSDDADPVEEGPLHRRLIRAQLPRHEGQVSTTRQAPDFTIRQPANARAKRFGAARPHRGGAAPFQGSSRQGGNGNSGGNSNASGAQRHATRQGGSRPGNNTPGGGRNRTK